MIDFVFITLITLLWFIVRPSKVNKEDTVEYWKKRTELAEDVIKSNNITEGWLYEKWESYVNHNTSFPWFDGPPPPKTLDKKEGESNSFFCYGINREVRID